ncbi:MAG: MBL fold metallo-hydrolase [Haloferacaceae archaeon]
MDVSRFPIPMGGVPCGSVNAYLVGDDPALLVDPGGRTDALDAAVAERNVVAVAATHTHADHVGALAHYAAETGATVYARRWFADRFRRASGVDPDRTLLEGDAIPLGEESIAVLDTPGHTTGHLSFVAPEGILCGDLAVVEGSVAVLAPEGDMRAYLTALRRLHARNPPALFPGHGPVADDPRATLERLIAHRDRRERRVAAAVAAGARELPEVLDRAYEKDLTGVRSMARATVRAHLEKLAVEGEIEWDGRRAAPGPG